jgi:hypothetical protein
LPEQNVTVFPPGIASLVRALVLGVSVATMVTSCVISEGPPFAEVSAETIVELEPGQTKALLFEVQAEAIADEDQRFRVILQEPSQAEQSNLGVTVEQRWSQKGIDESGWPETIDVPLGEPFIGDFHVSMTNNGAETLTLPVVVLAIADPVSDFGPTGGDESLRLAIRLR